MVLELGYRDVISWGVIALAFADYICIELLDSYERKFQLVVSD